MDPSLSRAKESPICEFISNHSDSTQDANANTNYQLEQLATPQHTSEPYGHEYWNANFQPRELQQLWQQLVAPETLSQPIIPNYGSGGYSHIEQIYGYYDPNLAVGSKSWQDATLLDYGEYTPNFGVNLGGPVYSEQPGLAGNAYSSAAWPSDASSASLLSSLSPSLHSEPQLQTPTEKPYLCTLDIHCQWSFKHQKDLIRHKNTVHQIGGGDKLSFRCRCSKENPRKDNHKRHCLSCNTTYYDAYRCRCGGLAMQLQDHIEHIVSCQFGNRRTGRPRA
ncbi:hypothetical protein F4808DRAFT_440438 [Astrocystis sublimbata]|nr:hypothetical protein F4808DRAFT_440438 [Astrocystis sublimbata]